MDNTIRNVSNLQRMLQESFDISSPVQTPINTPTTNNTYADNTVQNDIQHRSTGKERTATNQIGSSRLLHTIAGLQTQSNNKTDILIDSINRLTLVMQNMYEEQTKQTEILSSIARNTAISNMGTSVKSEYRYKGKSADDSIRNYGFNDGIALISELIMKLLHQAEIKVGDKNRRYRTTRTLKLQSVQKAVSVACKTEFRPSSEIQDTNIIKIPENKDPTMVRLASKIGSVDDTFPVLNATTLRDLFQDPEFRVFTTIFQSIMERLKIVRIMLPYYEADIINALNFPYFDKEGELLCDWSRLTPRSETEEEAIVQTTNVTNRENIGKMMAKRATIKSALRAVIKDKES